MKRPKDDIRIAKERALFPSRNVAVTLLVNSSKEILLVRTKHLPSRWQPVGGGIDGDDASAQVAAAREIEEETSLKVSADALICIYKAPYDFGAGLVHFFKLNVPNDVHLKMDKGELAEWKWFAAEATLDLPMFPATQECMRYVVANPSVLELKL
jgi:8-oxo-dGTP pyrophosphatase MutT (NUDIX family)